MALLRETLAHRIHPPLRQTKQSPRWAGHKPAFPILCRLVPHPPADPLTKADQVLRPTVPRHTSFPSDIFPPTTHHPPPSFAVWTPSLFCGGCSQCSRPTHWCHLGSVPQAFILLCCLSSYVALCAQTREWGVQSATRGPSALGRAVRLGWQPSDGGDPSNAWAQGTERATPPSGGWCQPFCRPWQTAQSHGHRTSGRNMGGSTGVKTLEDPSSDFRLKTILYWKCKVFKHHFDFLHVNYLDAFSSKFFS